MSNRDGRRAKQNKKKNFSNPKKKCPKCGSSLEGCGQSCEGHKHHKICKTCNYSNF